MRTTSRRLLGLLVSLALVLGTAAGTPAARAQDAPAFNPTAVAHSGGAACLGQLVAYAVRPHPGYEGHGLAGDAPGHDAESVAELMTEVLRPLCEAPAAEPTSD
jgi:hypothetical protein